MRLTDPGMRQLRLDPQGRLADPALLAEPKLRRLLDVLNRDGEQARVVGGAVRNALLGTAPGDIDVTTTATPDIVTARAKAARFRTIPTGIAHGTVTVLVDGAPFEVTTLRQDVETDGRHAVVRFGRDFRADAERRDFTVNALSVEADGTVHDTTGGIADLAAGRVRFIGEADRRIREDYLRILRFFRFHAAYGVGPLDPEGLYASVRHGDALRRLSRERIRAEFLKLLLAPGAVAVLNTMARTGLAAIILGSEAHPERLARLVRAEADRGAEPDALLRLLAVAVASPADVMRLRDMLRLSNAEQSRLVAAIAAWLGLDPERPPGPYDVGILLHQHGRQAACDAVNLAAADAGNQHRTAWDESLRLAGTAPEPSLPLGGAEVMARGVRNGRTVGAVLKRLQAAWIRAGFPQDPARLAVLLDQAIAEETGDS